AASAVERAIEMASPLFEARQHHLTLDLARGLQVEVDPVRFLQAVSNLLTNAAKFTPPGGSVKVRGFARGAQVILEVEDDGIGIEPAQLSAIFEPFVQAAPRTEDARGGLGLGLSLARDLIQLHGGTVEVESAGAGRGSCFRLRLPLGSSATAARPTASEPCAPAPAPRRVLVVDDNEDSADMLGLLLSELGHVVRVAYDGPQALAIAAELEPEIAVLDIGLPVMDGYELATRLRERARARSLRLVALTGFGQDRDRARVREAGFHRHLVKPVDAQELAAALAD
ncbi:MAG TPA: ATP-binding protein, partial [Polyangiaceae bacterium]|nr:ATP-binding protein [Polyangiaceae bacterium]